MEDPSDSRPPVASLTAVEGNGGAEALPPPSSSAQSDLVAVTGVTRAVVPSEGHTAIEGGGGVEEKEKEVVGVDGDRSGVVSGDDGGDPTVSGSGGDPATETVVSGGDVGGSGLGGGEDAPVSERVDERDEERSVERVEVHDVDRDGSSGSEEIVEERGIGVRGVGGSSGGGDRAEGTSGVTKTRAPHWRIEPRPSQQPSGGDKGKAVVIGGESAAQGPSGEPSAQGPVGISREDYIEHAPQEVVMAAAADAPGILDAAREAVFESREREAVLLREAADEDAAARAFWEEFETEEAAEEARIQAEEEERAAGLRTTVVQAARQWQKRRRPAFDAATYAPPVHLFVPSASEDYTPRRGVVLRRGGATGPRGPSFDRLPDGILALLSCLLLSRTFSS